MRHLRRAISYWGRALVLRTEPRQAEARPWRASIPIAEIAGACSIRSKGSVRRLRAAPDAPRPSSSTPTGFAHKAASRSNGS